MPFLIFLVVDNIKKNVFLNKTLIIILTCVNLSYNETDRQILRRLPAEGALRPPRGGVPSRRKQIECELRRKSVSSPPAKFWPDLGRVGRVPGELSPLAPATGRLDVS